jgi:hypothetical protein
MRRETGRLDRPIHGQAYTNVAWERARMMCGGSREVRLRACSTHHPYTTFNINRDCTRTTRARQARDSARSAMPPWTVHIHATNQVHRRHTHALCKDYKTNKSVPGTTCTRRRTICDAYHITTGGAPACTADNSVTSSRCWWLALSASLQKYYCTSLCTSGKHV